MCVSVPRFIDEDEATAQLVVVPHFVRLHFKVVGVPLDVIGFAKEDHDLPAIGPPSFTEVAVLPIGVGNPVVVLLHPLVAFGAGCGIAAAPELTDTAETLTLAGG